MVVLVIIVDVFLVFVETKVEIDGGDYLIVKLFYGVIGAFSVDVDVVQIKVWVEELGIPKHLHLLREEIVVVDGVQHVPGVGHDYQDV